MKLQNTLNIIFISLFIISFNVAAETVSDKAKACNVAMNKGDHTGAITIANEILKLDSNHHDGLRCKGRALGKQGNYNEALTLLQQAATSTQDIFNQIIDYILIGGLQKENKKYTEAISSYEKSLKLCEASNNQQYARISHNLIGDTHVMNDDLRMALNSYLAGDKLANNDNERADSAQRLATTYSALNQFDSAIEYQIKAVLMQQKSGALDDYANASLNLGHIYLKAKDLPNAERTYSKLVQFSRDNGGAYYEAAANFYLAKAKALAGDISGAKATLTTAYDIAKKIGATALVSEIEVEAKKQAD